MTAQQWERAKQTFEEVAELAPDDARKKLRDLCGDDTVVETTVLDLLSGDAADIPSSAGVPHTFATGSLINGRYRVLRYINRGGMGEVYEVEDTLLGGRVALKTLRSEALVPSRLDREVRVARGAAHENLCPVYDYCEHVEPDGRTIPFLTMALLEGETLAQRLQRNRPLRIAEAFGLIRQIAAGLQYLHEQGIIHRDLKPGNIMLTCDRAGRTRAVVMDFGLAQAAELDSSSTEWRAGAPYYMAPELFQGARPTPASDIFALGLVLDEMVTERRAFTGQSVPSMTYERLCENPEPPAARNAEIPRHWNDAILRCLERDPSRRFATAAGFAKALERGGRFRKRFALLAAATVLMILAVIAISAPMGPVSIEVFQITNETGDPKEEYLCKGLTNEVMRRIMKIPGLQVVPVHATRQMAQLKDRQRYALDGSLQRSGTATRLFMAVTDNSSGKLVWSEYFENKRLRDPVDLQTEIAVAATIELQSNIFQRAVRVAAPASLGSSLVRTVRAQDFPPPTLSNAALNSYMMGAYLRDSGSPQGVRDAIPHLQAAVGEDPNFALAYAALALTYLGMITDNFEKRPELIREARRYAQVAVTLDTGLPEAHEALGAVQETTYDWPGMEREFRTALKLRPSLTGARRRLAGVLVQTRRIDEALAEIRQVVREDPNNTRTMSSMGLLLFCSGQYDEARQVLEDAARRRNAKAASHNLGDVYAVLAERAAGPEKAALTAKALQMAERVRQIEAPRGRTSWADKMFATYHSMLGDPRDAEPHIRRLENDVRAGATSPAHLGLVYAIRGKRETALDLLEQSADMREPYPLFGRVLPLLKNLRGEPRFERLCARLKL